MNHSSPAAKPAKADFLEKEVHFQGRYESQVWKSLAQAYASWRVQMILILALGLVARSCLVGSANVVGVWVDSQCQGPHCRPMPAWLQNWTAFDFARLLVGMVCTALLLNLTFRIAIARIGTRAAAVLHDEVTVRVSRFPMNFFDRTPVGRALTRFSSDFESVLRMTGGPMGEFISLSFDALLSLLFMAFTGVFGLPSALLVGAIYVAIYFRNRMDIRTARRHVSAARGPAIAHFAETAQGFRSVKVYGRQALFTHRFNALSWNLQRARMAQQRKTAKFSIQMSIATAASLLVLGTLGIYLQGKAYVSVGEIVVVLTQVWLLSTTLQQYFEYVLQLEEALTGAERLDDYLHRPIEPQSALPVPRLINTPHRTQMQKFAIKQPDPRLGIEVENLSLRYHSDKPLVLSNVSFSLPAGESLGIVGRTGSGKSSLVQALFGLYPIEEGNVSICGLSLSQADIEVEKLRQLLAYIPQEPTLFRGSLRDNLSLRTDQDPQLIALLQRVGLGVLLSREGGLNQPVHERGANFSAGQKQLICLARAVIQDAPVIVMDEATSAVDPASEERLEWAIGELLKDRTRVIVAHRLSTLRACDWVLWMSEGRVKMFGRRDAVLNSYLAENAF
ncbi:ABC transporter ATP-binding protein [bacterium]|nr:ABC transporter ATP-binding protein [bacterium]